ncbi:MAG TPA: hypothetical protein VFQ61_17660 [Polyangiaceae bacterium]|nr:hypothetical protein [Polyangiaceae bacterium]
MTRARAKQKPEATALGQGNDLLREAELIRARDDLLKKIGRKRREAEKAEQAVAASAELVRSRFPALMTQTVRLSQEIHALFSALLRRDDLPRAAQRAVRQVYHSLRVSGRLAPEEGSDEDESDDESFHEPSDDFDAEFDAEQAPPRTGRRGGAAPGPEQRVGSASPAGARPGNSGLKDLFRKLAVALHPDRTRDEREREERTRIMKEVTRAYEEGDLARLMQIEASLVNGGPDVTAGPASEVRAQRLNKLIEELKTQLRELSKQVRELRRASREFVFAGGRKGISAAEALELAERELGLLREIHEYVLAFSERRMSLHEFMAGPPALREEEQADEIPEELAELIFEMFSDAPAPSRRSGGKKRRRR